MARTLVIKGVNFASNKLDTVSLIESIPCTAIVLNKNTAEIKCGSTETLVATPTPSNTTDSISWASSDETVATVSDGVVTVVGVGTATVTATCGSQSDTCEVTATADIDTDNAVKLVGYRISNNSLESGSNGLSSLSSTSLRGTIFSSTGTYPIQKTTVADYTPKPYKMPQNTNRIRVTVPSGTTIGRIGWYNDATSKNWDGVYVCPMIGVTTSPTIIEGVMEMAIPSYESYADIDSLIISFQRDVDFVQTDFDGITVEFLHVDNE